MKKIIVTPFVRYQVADNFDGKSKRIEAAIPINIYPIMIKKKLSL